MPLVSIVGLDTLDLHLGTMVSLLLSRAFHLLSPRALAPGKGTVPFEIEALRLWFFHQDLPIQCVILKDDRDFVHSENSALSFMLRETGQ
jgi:hypothetical protein